MQLFWDSFITYKNAKWRQFPIIPPPPPPSQQAEQIKLNQESEKKGGSITQISSTDASNTSLTPKIQQVSLPLLLERVCVCVSEVFVGEPGGLVDKR